MNITISSIKDSAYAEPINKGVTCTNMRVETKTESISYLEVATRQLNRAIKLFFEEDYISSLTLAGAAEEILGEMVRKSGGTTSLDARITYSLEFSDHDVNDKKARSEVARLENFFRNRLKHHIDDFGDGFTFSSDYFTAELIGRAIDNYYALGHKPTEDIEYFVDQVQWQTRNQQINQGQG